MEWMCSGYGVLLQCNRTWSGSPWKLHILVDSIRILEGVYLEFTRTPWQCSMAATLREVLMDSRWTPGKLQVNSRYCVWSLFGLLMESIRMRGSVSRAPSSARCGLLAFSHSMCFMASSQRNQGSPEGIKIALASSARVRISRLATPF